MSSAWFPRVGRLGGVAVFAAGAGVAYGANKRRRLPERFVLELDLSKAHIVEKRAPARERFASRLRGDNVSQPLVLREATAAIRAAASDLRVAGLVALLPPSSTLPLSHAQELGAAISEFRRARESVSASDASIDGGSATTPTMWWSAGGS